MDAIKLTVNIPEDRKLVIELPSDLPVGKAEITVQPLPKATNVAELRERLIAAGLITVEPDDPDLLGFERLPDEELHKLTRLKPAAKSLDEIISEDREGILGEELIHLPPDSKTASEMIIEDRGEY